MPDEYDELLNSFTPRSSRRSFRTDRNNNPIAAAVGSNGRNQFTQALDDAGIAWEPGDIFPQNEGGASMRTIRIKGDAFEGARAILSRTNAIQGWYAKSTGRNVLPKYNVRSNEDFARLPRSQQDEIINGIYQSEGGRGHLTASPTDDYDSLLDELSGALTKTAQPRVDVKITEADVPPEQPAQPLVFTRRTPRGTTSLNPIQALDEVLSKPDPTVPGLAGLQSVKYEPPASKEIGERVRVPFSAKAPTNDEAVTAFLSTLGPQYVALGEKFKQETGQSILNLGGAVTQDEDGSFYVRPSRGAIDFVNAYAKGGLDAAIAEGNRQRGEDITARNKAIEEAKPQIEQARRAVEIEKQKPGYRGLFTAGAPVVQAAGTLMGPLDPGLREGAAEMRAVGEQAEIEKPLKSLSTAEQIKYGVGAAIPTAGALLTTRGFGAAQLPVLSALEGSTPQERVRGALEGAVMQTAMGPIPAQLGESLPLRSQRVLAGTGLSAIPAGQAIARGEPVTSAVVENLPFAVLPLISRGQTRGERRLRRENAQAQTNTTPRPTENFRRSADSTGEAVTPEVRTEVPRSSASAEQPSSLPTGVDAVVSLKPKLRDPAVESKPPWEMSRSELESALTESKATQRNLLTELFGQDAEKYENLERRYLRTQNDTEAAQLKAQMNEMSRHLTKEQLSRWEEEPLYATEDYQKYRDLLDSVAGFSSSEANLARWLAEPITQLGRESDPRRMTDRQREAYAQLRYAAETAREQGFDQQKLLTLTLKEARKQFSDPADAEFMLRNFFGSASASRARSEQASPVATQRHVDLQPRRVRGEGKGQFKKESASQREERRAQVNPPAVEQPPIQPVEPSVSETPTSPEIPLLKRGEPNVDISNRPAAVRGVELPVSETAPPPLLKREPSATSARQEMTASDRAALDLPELPPAERRSWQQTLNEAKARGSHNASILADEVLAKPRPLNDIETAQLVLRASELKTIHAERMKEIESASDPDTIQALRNQAEALEGEFNKLTSATKASGTEKGRALASQKLTINQDFDLISVLQRAKASKGRELNAQERAKFEGMTKRVKELEGKLLEAQEGLKTRSIQREIDKIKRQTKRSETRRALDDEFADLRTAFAQAKMETRSGVQASGLAGIDPEGKLTVLMVRMARNRVRAGVNDAGQIVDVVYEAVREHVEGITKREVRDAISGYGLTKDRRSDIEREIGRLRNKMQRVSREEDIEAGVLSRRREGPRKSEARTSGIPLQGPRRSDAYRLPAEGPKRSDALKLPAQGPRLSEGVGIVEGPTLGPVQGPHRSEANRLRAEGPKITDAPFVGPRKNTIRQRIESQIAEYERKLREEDYAEAAPKPRPIYDRQTSNLQAQLEGLKRQVEAEIRGNDSRLETILAMRKAGMLTGLRTHARNIGGTGAFQAFEEVSRIPGSVADLLVSTVTKQRALGGPNPVAVAKSSYAAATKGLREAVQIMKHGASADELAKLERPRELNSGSKIIDTYVNTVFRTLGAEDKVFRTYAFERSIQDQKRLLKTDKVTPEMEAQAILDAEVATFNNQNKLAEGVEWVRNRTGIVGSTAIDLVIPFRRTPANITSRLLESTPLGLARGVGQLFKAAINKKMSFEDQRKFSQTVGRSVTGSSLLLLGYWMASQNLATGLSESDAGDREVQKASGRSPLAIRIGDNWHQVGSFSPIGNLIAVGAALHREQTRPLKEGEERGNIATAALPVAARVMMDQPFLKGTSGAVEAIESPYSKGEAFVGQTIGSFVPTAVADVASLEDNKRRAAKTIPERVQARVPILRRQLSEDVDVFSRPLQSRRTAFFDPTLTARNSNDPFIQELIRLDVGVPKAQRKPGESDDRYRARQIQQGKEMARLLSQTVASREYQRLDDAGKITMLKEIVEQTRRAVNAASSPAGRERRRRSREGQVPSLLRRELRQIERRAQ